MESKCEVPGVVSHSEILLELLLGGKGGKIHSGKRVSFSMAGVICAKQGRNFSLFISVSGWVRESNLAN